MAGKIHLTEEGYKKLKEELDSLIKKKRPEIIKRIKEAKEYGDLSENAEYENAKNEQSFVEGRIKEIEGIFKNVQIIGKKTTPVVVSLGCEVKLEVEGKEFTYTIVGSTEADPTQGKISNESAVGQAILGKKVGEIVKVDTPSGIIEYKIKEIK